MIRGTRQPDTPRRSSQPGGRPFVQWGGGVSRPRQACLRFRAGFRDPGSCAGCAIVAAGPARTADHEVEVFSKMMRWSTRDLPTGENGWNGRNWAALEQEIRDQREQIRPPHSVDVASVLAVRLGQPLSSLLEGSQLEDALLQEGSDVCMISLRPHGRATLRMDKNRLIESIDVVWWSGVENDAGE